jgi:dienelactone hydrolase
MIGSQLLYSLVAVGLLSGCASAHFTDKDVDKWQPTIVSTEPPDKLFWNSTPKTFTSNIGFNDFKSIIPAYNGKENLLASWNPAPGNVKNNPTFVIIHGGHGVVATNAGEALWLRKQFNANILILDSFWSRGIKENWATKTQYGANMRALDALSAGKWLRDVQKIDTDKLFLMGDSQGGWTVLRTFTNETLFANEGKNLYRGGIALYPYCESNGTSYAPALGPYYNPVIIFTGGKDTGTPVEKCDKSIFYQATEWTHYPEATHAFNTTNRGLRQRAVDGECSRALNIYNKFAVCRDDKATYDMRRKIVEFVSKLTDMSFEKQSKIMRDTDWDPSHEHVMNKGLIR